MARRLIVLRHGETGHNAAGIWQGQLDVALSDVGVAQARAAAPLIAARRPDLVVSSDLARAAATADLVGELLGVEVERDERFREIHVGEWQGRSGDEVRAEYPVEAERMLTGDDFRRGGTGESVAEVATRTLAGALDVIDRLPEDGIAVIVSHGVAARALAAELVGLPQKQAWLQLGGLRNCHWAELGQVRSGGWRIDAWNLGAPDAVEGAPWPTER
ncbi:histidine phosphatase family protein [Arsenicicoccus sp. oral taxon 190]|uniref:histidine phosphatase family protein n=1 Tax=Arsenicicoccus sp. oral taxon 190 TaxID=1658671 RepID=UPI00067A3A37|nr:histidine phosphatase family protein [Arsenicicoccus sp. oral taxon 190]AKT51583.1 phosphoglycerate mutase [Arsenicicoccus sp. oral taxon 190]